MTYRKLVRTSFITRIHRLRSSQNLRDLLLCKQTENAPLCFFSDREEAASLAYSFTTPTLLSLCDSVSDATERLRANANVRLTVTAMAQQCDLL